MLYYAELIIQTNLAYFHVQTGFVFRMLYYAELIIQTDSAYFHVQTGFDMLFVAFVINQLMVWLQLQLMCCFFLVESDSDSSEVESEDF
jgi:hypothetical protein